VVLPELHLRLGELEGVRQHLRPRLEESLRDAELVGHARCAVLAAPQELRDKARALLGNVGVEIGESKGVVIFLCGSRLLGHLAFFQL